MPGAVVERSSAVLHVAGSISGGKGIHSEGNAYKKEIR